MSRYLTPLATRALALIALMFLIGFTINATGAGAQEPDVMICNPETGATMIVQASHADGEGELDYLNNGWSTDCTGSITIVKDTDPEDNDGTEFDFDGSFDFELEDDEQITFAELEPGSYTFRENETAGYVLTDIDCDGADVIIEDDRARVTVDLGPGEDATCTFTNDAVPEATPEPTSTPEPTATAAPSATTVVTLTTCAGTAQIVEVNGAVVSVTDPHPDCVPEPTATTAPSNGITPPSTGDAGLLQRFYAGPQILAFWGGANGGVSCPGCTYYPPTCKWMWSSCFWR